MQKYKRLTYKVEKLEVKKAAEIEEEKKAKEEINRFEITMKNLFRNKLTSR